MQRFVIRTERDMESLRFSAFKDETETVEVDYAPWEDDNGPVTIVDLVVKSGQVEITNESLSSSVFQFNIRFIQSGLSMLQFKATSGNNIHVTNMGIRAKDLYLSPIDDYGFCR